MLELPIKSEDFMLANNADPDEMPQFGSSLLAKGLECRIQNILEYMYYIDAMSFFFFFFFFFFLRRYLLMHK